MHGEVVSLSKDIPLKAIVYDDSRGTSTHMGAAWLKEWGNSASRWMVLEEYEKKQCTTCWDIS